MENSFVCGTPILLGECEKAIHQFFREKNFIFFDLPYLQYRYAYLTKAINIGKDHLLFLSPSNSMLVSALSSEYGAVYSLGHAFRDDKDDKNHLTEFHLVEAEWATNGVEHLFDFVFELVQYVIRSMNQFLMDNKMFGNYPIKKTFKNKFKCLSFKTLTDSISGITDIEKAMDFLMKRIEVPVFLSYLPIEYTWRALPFDSKYGYIFNLIFPKIGEVAELSIKHSDFEFYSEKFKYLGFDSKMNWFLCRLKKNSKPHSSFGLGIDRLLAWYLNIENIRNIQPFPEISHLKEFL